MMLRQKIKTAIDNVLEIEIAEESLLHIAPTIVEEYKDLNNKCDIIMEKIKRRRSKTSSSIKKK